MREAYELTARKRATQVLAEFGIDSFPMEPKDLASARDLAVETADKFPGGAYGALMRTGNTFKIIISADCPTLGHQRFTVAHELGHFFLDGHVEALFSQSQDVHISVGANFRGRKDPYEVEADNFASELLAPAHIARPLIDQLPVTVASVKVVADRFGTSLSSAGVRFATLTGEPTAVLISYNHVVEWIAFSPAMANQGWSKRRWKGEWSPPMSATTKLSRDHARITRGDLETACGLLTEWFEEAPAAEIREDALGLGRFGRVLTVLHCPDLPISEEIEERSDRGPRDWRDALRDYSLDDL